MKLGKWTCEVIIVVVLLCVGLGVWWFVSTKDQRAAKAQYEQLVRYANRQAVQIAIIEQASKLENYKQQLAKRQQARTRKIAQSVMPNPTPFTTDPNK